MKTQTINTDLLSYELIKSLALKSHLGEDFIVLDDKAFEGTEEESLRAYNEATGQNITASDDDQQDRFYDWCVDNLVEVEEYDEDSSDNDYLVLTDEEADEKAKEYILNSLWAFNASFIVENSDLPWEAEEMIRNFQQDRWEGANDTISALIKDKDSFVENAISADGRGHFMNSYDGEENEETIGDTTYYIYRMN